MTPAQGLLLYATTGAAWWGVNQYCNALNGGPTVGAFWGRRCTHAWGWRALLLAVWGLSAAVWPVTLAFFLAVLCSGETGRALELMGEVQARWEKSAPCRWVSRTFVDVLDWCVVARGTDPDTGAAMQEQASIPMTQKEAEQCARDLNAAARHVYPHWADLEYVAAPSRTGTRGRGA